MLIVSLLEQRDRALGAGPLGFFGELGLVGRDEDGLAADRHESLIVGGQQLGRQLVAAAVAGALLRVDEELHGAGTFHASGRSSGAVMPPPPRSMITSSPVMWKSGITRSHSSTATAISRRARCMPRQRWGPLAKPKWLFFLRSMTNSLARSHTRGSRLAPITRP